MPFPFAAPPPPKTVTKEWEEAMTERAREHNMDPINGKLRRHPSVYELRV